MYDFKKLETGNWKLAGLIPGFKFRDFSFAAHLCFSRRGAEAQSWLLRLISPRSREGRKETASLGVLAPWWWKRNFLPPSTFRHPPLTAYCSLLAFLLLFFCLATLTAPAAPPAWWTTRGVLATNAPDTNDFAAVNIGQVKWIATQAKAELEANLPGGCGSAVSNLVAAFTNMTTAHDFAVANAGQVKAIAAPFYDCLRTNHWPCLLPQGMTTNQCYPWSTATNAPQDFATVNLGQLKYIFSFSF